MVFGMSIATFTTIHTAISLVAIVAGLVVLAGLISGRRLDGWTLLFLLTTIATSVTGFGFPFGKLLPSHIVGIISLVILAAAVVTRYALGLSGHARWIYVVSAIVALYLNVFVLIVQAFQKIAVLRTLAPTQSEPPFLVAQVAVLVLFIVLGAASLRRFRPAAI